MKAEITERIFHFRQPAHTSRGCYTTHLSRFVTLSEGEARGVGECSVLPDLSCDALPPQQYHEILAEAAQVVAATGRVPVEMLRPYPSILFGLETALWNLRLAEGKITGGKKDGLRPRPLSPCSVPVNGLVWMGTFDQMMQQLEEKLAQGFRCVKLKIGAIDWERERTLIAHVRHRFGPDRVEIRVDANGGFTPDMAMRRLEELATYRIHSIEQPIRQGQWAEMARLCASSPLPVALDEELIGINDVEGKIRLLDAIRPQYIVLKPSLHGGMTGTREWVELARERGIASWITSALESNVGLQAVARLCFELYGPEVTFPQGLGTGMLYTDNIDMPLEIRGDRLCFSTTF